MAITVERYLKVVHPFWSKRNLKRWMMYATIVFAWIGGILSVAPVTFVSTIVADGSCLPYFVWESPAIQLIVNIWNLFSFFFVPLIVFVFCYARIVVVMRRQIRVMAAHNAEGSAQRGRLRPDDGLADPVQTNQVERRQDDDRRRLCPAG